MNVATLINAICRIQPLKSLPVLTAMFEIPIMEEILLHCTSFFCVHRPRDSGHSGTEFIVALRPKGQHCQQKSLPAASHLLESQLDLLSHLSNTCNRLRFKGVNCRKVIPINLAHRLLAFACGSGRPFVVWIELSPASRSDAKAIHVW